MSKKIRCRILVAGIPLLIITGMILSLNVIPMLKARLSESQLRNIAFVYNDAFKDDIQHGSHHFASNSTEELEKLVQLGYVEDASFLKLQHLEDTENPWGLIFSYDKNVVNEFNLPIIINACDELFFTWPHNGKSAGALFGGRVILCDSLGNLYSINTNKEGELSLSLTNGSSANISNLLHNGTLKILRPKR